MTRPGKPTPQSDYTLAQAHTILLAVRAHQAAEESDDE
jgi:hypothetical protein